MKKLMYVLGIVVLIALLAVPVWFFVVPWLTSLGVIDDVLFVIFVLVMAFAMAWLQS